MSLKKENKQMSFVISVHDLVRADHPYRKILYLIDFEELTKPLESLYSKQGRAGYPISTGFKCLLLQFMNNLSDRELEECIQDSNAAKLFVGFELKDKTPDHTYFTKLRSRIGCTKLAELFERIRLSLQETDDLKEIFTFIDASSLLSLVDTWKARDKALADLENDEKDDDDKPTMNNKNISKYLSDPDARYGCKGKSDFWCGYKRTVSVDMQSGLINKVYITSADVPDSAVVPKVMPSTGMVCADKGYTAAISTLRRNKLHPGVILKNNMKEKNKDKDRFISRLRMPHEAVFSKQSKITKYKTRKKVQFQAIFEAMAYNFKKLIKFKEDPLILLPA